MYFIDVVGVKAVTIRSPRYLWSWNTSLRRGYVPLSYHFWSDSALFKVISLFKNVVYTVRCVPVFNSKIEKVLHIFYYSSHTNSIKTPHPKCISAYFLCIIVKDIKLTLLYNRKHAKPRINLLQWCWRATVHNSSLKKKYKPNYCFQKRHTEYAYHYTEMICTTK